MSDELSPGAALAVARWNKPGAGRTITSVVCPVCKAGVNDPCLSSTGKTLSHGHRARENAYEKAKFEKSTAPE